MSKGKLWRDKGFAYFFVLCVFGRDKLVKVMYNIIVTTFERMDAISLYELQFCVYDDIGIRIAAGHTDMILKVQVYHRRLKKKP